MQCMAKSIQTSYRTAPEVLEKMDTMARWLHESRSSVVTRAVNELYVREATKRGVNPYPEVDPDVAYPAYDPAPDKK